MHRAFDERRYLIPFRAALLPQIFTDVLVIGGGVAGMRAAIAAADPGRGPDGRGDAPPASGGTEVILLTKGALTESNTFWAQGGIAAVLDSEDTIEAHVQDTLIAGAGLCDEPVVRRVVEAGPARVRELIDYGMTYDRAEGGGPDLGREGGHGHPRILHANGDATGRAMGQALHQRVTDNPSIRLFDHCFVLDLITVQAEGGAPDQCLGAITHHAKYGLQVIWAQATILASGGAGQVYRESTNPPVATGDGLAMAYRAGAQLADFAFMQFHPTTLYVAGSSRSLITEAVRGEGAHLIDRNGHRFMPDYDDRAELAPRDIVSRAILKQMAKTGHSHVFLDVRHLGKDHFTGRFPGIAALLDKFEIDPADQLIPVHPSAHYMIGGVRADMDGRTSLPGLYACGEASCTGLHGANRLASNSLLEGLVFGEAAGRACHELIEPGQRPRPLRIISDIPISDRSELDLADVRSSLRAVMWRHVGIEREGDRLNEIQEMFAFWARYTMDKIFDEQSGWETQNLLTIGALMTRAAQWRTESRGTHFRVDHPQPVEAMRRHDVWTRGQPEPTTPPVVESAPTACD